MRLTLAIAALMIVTPAMAVDVTKSLLTGWYASNAECRGEPGDSPRSNTGCAARSALDDELKALGMCYREGDRWVKCGR